MAKKTKRVILFIVEGPTDEDALSPILKQIFETEDVRFHIVFGDITTDNEVNEREIIKEVNAHIKQEMDRYGYKKKDILKVIHLLDTDGAFIPETCICASSDGALQYTDEQILCREPAKMLRRNQKKRTAVQRLCTTAEIAKIPYSALYFSRNLEHVLHGKTDNLSDDEKIDLADEFADKYINDIESFKTFIRTESFAVAGSYRETWDYIMEGTNSLKRNSNFHLVLNIY